MIQIAARLALHRLRSEAGIAMIAAIGTLGVLTIAAVTTIAYTSSNSRSAELSADDNNAYTLAEAGFNEMLAILNKQGNDSTNPSLLPQTTSTYENGTVTRTGTFNSTNWKWTLTSTGFVKNSSGSGAAQKRRTLTAVVPVYPVNTQPLGADAWNYVYSYGTGDPDGCDMLINAGVNVTTRLMAAGNLCWANGAMQSAGELIIGGTNTVNGSATIGTSSVPIARMDANGCRVGTGTLHDPCQGPPANADKVWATILSSNPEIETPPNPDLNAWYLNASPGPHHPCEAPTGTPPVFENEISPKLRNRSVAGTFNLTPASSYTCRTTGGGTPLGELSWNNTTKVLTVRGTIFIDGNAYVSQDGTYDGQATLYLSGSFVLNGAKFCAVKSSGVCNYATGAWNPNTRLLTIVANGDGGQAGISTGQSVMLTGGGNTEWQGAIYGGPYQVNLASNVKASGPIIADEVILNSSLQQQGFSTITEAPTGMPGNPVIVAQPDEPELYAG